MAGVPSSSNSANQKLPSQISEKVDFWIEVAAQKDPIRLKAFTGYNDEALNGEMMVPFVLRTVMPNLRNVPYFKGSHTNNLSIWT